MNASEKQVLAKIADTIRVISCEAVEKATCGHPGLPMGCAELGAVLFGRHLRYNPKNPNWLGRDRFILSAGHGSMLIYSLLHLSGYNVSMDDLKSFRQKHSKTPGHPEFAETPGVETTTGPLGQGIAAATGMALAQKIMGSHFGKEHFDSKIFALCGDGCLMEGISAEASSFAGHLGLSNLVIIYDSNDICLDGPTCECFTEDVAKRYTAYGWRVINIDGNEIDQVDQAFDDARKEDIKPVIIIAKTVIGKGSPNKQGKSACHGAALGADEVKLVKQQLGWPEEAFYVPQEVYAYFKELAPKLAKAEADWNTGINTMTSACSEKAALWNTFVNQKLPDNFEDALWDMDLPSGKATRAQSQAVLTKVAEMVPFFISGSADLSGSDNTAIKGCKIIDKDCFDGKNIKFGVREFAMAAACYGMRLTGLLQPLCGTFFTFSDYMKNAIRLAALMKQRVFFQFTHDSLLLGEDGPTHQPIEHLAALRAMPNITVYRPADENETKAAWIEAFKADGPVAFILSRQNVKDISAMTSLKAREGVSKGAYVLCGPKEKVDVQIYATGAEIGLAIDTAKLLEAKGKTARIISFPSWERFEAQDAAYKKSILDAECVLRVSIEAGSEMGWHKFIGRCGLTISIDQFGASAPYKDLCEMYGFNAPAITEKIMNRLNCCCK